MRKILYSCIVIAILCSSLLAQRTQPAGDRNYFGFEAGLNYNWYTLDSRGFFFRVPYPYTFTGATTDLSFDDLGSGLGFQLGATGDLNLVPRLALMGKVVLRYHSTSATVHNTSPCANDDGITFGTATFERNYDASYTHFGGDLLLRFQIDPESWYVFGGIGLAALVGNSVTLREDILSSDNDCQYLDDFGTPVGTAMPIYTDQELNNFFSSSHASPKLGVGTFIPLGDNGLMLTPELSISMPLNELVETDNQINEASSFEQPKMWFTSLTVGIKFPWGGSSTRTVREGQPETVLAGRVLDRKTNAPLDDADVTIVDLSTNEEVDNQTTGENGSYGIVLYPGRYSVTASKDEYMFNSTYFEVSNDGKIVKGNPDIYLEKPPAKIRLLVFFDFNKSDLTAESNPELKRALKMMNQYPRMEVEIAGHTDNVGSDQYNKELSQQRANAVRTYLTVNGIDASRLTAVGYGEAQPVDSNDNEDGRAANRRVEFIVKNM